MVDLLADRQPFSKYAIRLFAFGDKKKVRLYTSSHSVATTHYILKKSIDEAALRKLVLSLLDFVQVISIDLSVIKKSLLSDHKDFEDAIQISAAESVDDLDFIVTRNLKDFKGSKISAVAPDEAIRLLN